ncbi:hypothetical protein T439DRAFT_327262 [Meredithblackwellia eburnea MCA 4105]
MTKETLSTQMGTDPVIQGYLLKKKKKKLQGLARRYFRLSASGALSYSFNPTSPIRDSVLVTLSYVRANRKQRTFHIDNGANVMHCKALTQGDFDRWTTALRGFIIGGQEGSLKDDESDRKGKSKGKGKGPAPTAGGVGRTPGPVDIGEVRAAVGRMHPALQDLEALHAELLLKLQTSSTSSLATADHASTSSPSPASTLHHSPSNVQSQPAPPLPVTSPSPKFKFLKKHNNNNNNSSPHSNINRSVSSASSSHQGSGGEDYFDAKSSPTPPPPVYSEHVVKQLGTTVAALKAQYDVLLEILVAATHGTEGGGYGVGYYGSRQASEDSSYYGGDQTARSLTPVPLRTYASRSSAAFFPASSRPGSTRASSILSGHTTDEEFYEPDEGIMPGEFVLEEEEEEELSSSDEESHKSHKKGDKKGSDSEESKDDVMSFESIDELEEGEVDDEEREEQRREERLRRKPSPGAGGKQEEVKAVERRSQLPHPIAGDEFSMLGMLRKNVGKDLSTISFPVTMNEPLSSLQRIAEELEYADLLHRAAATTDPIERLTLVAVFAISGTSGNKYRSSRKPFNPLLGETFELIRSDKGFKFVSEKVSHHPPILAFHTEGAKGWTIDGHIAPSQKFWGRSMEVFVHGDYNVRFQDTGEEFSIKRPSSFVRNLVAGTKYLEVVGDLVVTNKKTNAKAVINFKEGSTWGGASTRNKLEGKVCDPNGNVKAELVGRWDEHVDKKEGKDNYTRLWRIGEFPSHAEKYYGFSTFAVQLNETTSVEKGVLPASDSRLRPDQLALEVGNVDEAEETKKRVEEKQRMKRKDGGGSSNPKFFVPDGEGWKFGGDYFKLREKKAFEDPDIF